MSRYHKKFYLPSRRNRRLIRLILITTDPRQGSKATTTNKDDWATILANDLLLALSPIPEDI